MIERFETDEELDARRHDLNRLHLSAHPEDFDRHVRGGRHARIPLEGYTDHVKVVRRESGGGTIKVPPRLANLSEKPLDDDGMKELSDAANGRRKVRHKKLTRRKRRVEFEAEP